MRKSFQCYQGTLSVVFNDDDVLFILFPLFLLFLDSPLVVYIYMLAHCCEACSVS